VGGAVAVSDQRSVAGFSGASGRALSFDFEHPGDARGTIGRGIDKLAVQVITGEDVEAWRNLLA